MARRTEPTMQILHETDAAVLVTLGAPSEAVWLPKSQIEKITLGRSPATRIVTVPEWLAQERGLI